MTEEKSEEKFEDAKNGEADGATEVSEGKDEEDVPVCEAEDLNEKIKERLKELLAEQGLEPESLEGLEQRKVKVKLPKELIF